MRWYWLLPMSFRNKVTQSSRGEFNSEVHHLMSGRGPGAVYTQVRTRTTGATRPVTTEGSPRGTEMQSDNRCIRIALTARRNTEDNTMTSERLKAQGKSIKRPVLTGSLLQNC